MNIKAIIIAMAFSGTAFAQDCGPPPEPAPVAEDATVDELPAAAPVLHRFAWNWGPFTLDCQWQSVEPPIYACVDSGGVELLCTPSGQCLDAQAHRDGLERLRGVVGAAE